MASASAITDGIRGRTSAARIAGSIARASPSLAPLVLSLGCDVLLQVMLSLGPHIMLCMISRLHVHVLQHFTFMSCFVMLGSRLHVHVAFICD